MAAVTQPCIGVANRSSAADGGGRLTSSPPTFLKLAAKTFRASTLCSALGTDRSEISSDPPGRKKRLKEVEEEEEGKLNLKDYFDQAETLIRSSGGAGTPPRWFSPLECRFQLEDSPLLIYLPGIDGTGLGLILQQQKLGKVFDIWCLHIPTTDRTPFPGLVQLVEETVQSENQRLKGRPVFIIGESLGACLALAVAARNPDIDIALILANPGTSYCNSQLRYLLPILEVLPAQLFQSLPELLSLISGQSFSVALHLQQIVQDISQGLALLSSYHSVLARILPGETLLWRLQLIKSASAHVNSRLHVCHAQILVLASGKDQLLPSRVEAERLYRALPKHDVQLLNNSGKMPRCETRLFKDASHFLFMEHGIDLASIIKGTSFYRRAKSHDYVHDFVPPTRSEFHKVHQGFKWIDAVADPVMLSTLGDGKIVRGLAGIPCEGPVIFVGYHMLLGLEIYPMVSRFLAEKDILLRGLAHPMLFTRLKEKSMETSVFDAYRIMGAVPVSPNNLYKLLSSKSFILLYPGGMREALHHKGEEYQLFWPERSEFIRMAARFGAKIVPFGVVGEDDICHLAFDYKDQVKIPYLRDYNKRTADNHAQLRTDAEGEVAKQYPYFPVVLPKLPGRFYYLFGNPIDTSGMKNELRDKESAHEVYMQVKSEVETCIAYLREKRETDPYRSVFARLLHQATTSSAAEIPTFEI